MSGKPDLAALFGATKSDTFLGLDKVDDLSNLSAPIAILGAPGATPYGSVGAYCQNAPDALRQATGALTSNLDRHNFDLGGPTFPDAAFRPVDCGNLPFHQSDFEENRRVIRRAVQAILGKGAVPVLIGGDDSVPIPMLEALECTGERFFILQLDAHIDWRKDHMGEDMGLSSTMRRASEMPHIQGIVQVGARSIGSGHSDDLADAQAWGAKFVTAYDVHRDGVQAALDLIPEGANVVICLDVDVLDPSIVPGVIGRAPGGLSYFQCLDLIRGTAQKARIAAIDFVEYMPEVDVADLGALTVSRLITSTLGILARQQAR